MDIYFGKPKMGLVRRYWFFFFEKIWKGALPLFMESHFWFVEQFRLKGEKKRTRPSRSECYFAS